MMRHGRDMSERFTEPPHDPSDQPVGRGRPPGPAWVRWVTTSVLFGLCGYGLLAHWIHPPVVTQATPAAPTATWDSIRSGRFFREAEVWLKERSWLTYQLRGVYNETRFRMGVLEPALVQLADGGWMYLKAHVSGVPERHGAQQAHRNRHLEAIHALAERLGIDLLVTVAPAKPLVHPEAVFGGEVPRPRQLVHDQLLSDLRASGLDVLDLQGPLRELARGGRPVYYKRDVHWTTKGSIAVAGMVHERLQQLGWYRTPRDGVVLGRQMIPGWHLPDLVNLLGMRSVVPLGRQSANGLVASLQEPGQLPTVQVVDRRGAAPVRRAPREADPASHYALVGDSFSLPHRLGTALCMALQSEVHRGFVSGGARPPTLLYECLHAIHKGELAAKVVVWEFLERHGGDERWAEPVPGWAQELLAEPKPR